jgi:hypothetical protein
MLSLTIGLPQRWLANSFTKQGQEGLRVGDCSYGAQLPGARRDTLDRPGHGHSPLATALIIAREVRRFILFATFLVWFIPCTLDYPVGKRHLDAQTNTVKT